LERQEYNDEKGNRPQASTSGDMIPSRPTFPTEQPSNLGIGSAGSGADASKSSNRVTTGCASTTTTKWIRFRDRMLLRGIIFLALVVTIGLFGYLTASRGGGKVGGIQGDPALAQGSIQGETCGDGNIGNGICMDASLCCSKWG
jgi:hypothetical protein